MTAKIDVELQNQIKSAQSDPQREIPVIVSLAAGANIEKLAQRGLKINRIFDAIEAVAGTLTAAEINALSKWDQVNRIEYDGEMHAL